MRDGKRMTDDRPDRPSELSRLEVANARLLGEARLLLALAMMFVVLVGTKIQSPNLVLAVLLPYGFYGAALMLRGKRRQRVFGSKHAHWIDAACYLVAIGLSGGFASPLFLALLFPVLVVSLRSGFQRGATIALIFALLFAGLGELHAGLDPEKDIEAAAHWPVVTLLLVGLVVARWGSSEYTLLRRLAFLNDLKRLASPRYGIAPALCQLAALLRTYLHAERCTVLLNDPDSDGYLTCDSLAGPDCGPMRGERIGPEAAAPLVRTPSDVALIHSKPRHFWQRAIAGGYDHASGQPRPVDALELEELANLLETDSFVSLPLYCRDRPVGRIYATSRRHRYAPAELEFLQQAVGHAALVIDTIQLVDRLASDKASRERQRISRDLHDGTIQPYIGLKLGLEALRRRVRADDPLLSEVIDLTRMADEGIAELRRYVAGLRDPAAKREPEPLLVAIRRLADRFAEFYGIKVHVLAEGDFRLSEPMLDEVMNIVREGLANIRRHSTAQSATVSVREADGRLVVEFVNENGMQARSAHAFFPRSLNERASDLGGRVEVGHREDGHTRVAVEIPV